MRYSTEYISSSTIGNREEQFFNKFINTIEKVEAITRRIKELNEYVRDDSEYYQEALFLAYDEAGPLAYDVLTTEMLKACIESVEFNYQPYIEHLLTAIRMHGNDLISISIDRTNLYGNPFSVYLNTDVLGDVGIWANAVESARSLLGIGKTRGDTHEESGENLASKIWREKIYGTAREGRSVTKKYKGRGKDKKGAGEKDVTYKYAEKYEQTILARLGLLSPDIAPFWNIIEHGNINLEFVASDNEGGYPYPTVSPSFRKENVTFEIKRILNDLYHEYFERVKDEIANQYIDLGITEKEIDENYLENLLKEWIETGSEEDINKTYKALAEIAIKEETGEFKRVVVEGFETTAGQQIRLRDKKSGRFTSKR